MVTEAPIVVHYKQGLKIIMKIDFFDYISSRVFFQLKKDGLLYLIAFFLKNLNPTKCNYKLMTKNY